MKSNREDLAEDGLEKPSRDKQNYHPPQLKVYGDIRSMTRGGAPSSMSDSGMNEMS